MFTQVTLRLHHVWDDCLWSVSATYDDGSGGVPVTIVKQGRASAHGLDYPADLLAACVAAVKADVTRDIRQDGSSLFRL